MSHFVYLGKRLSVVLCSSSFVTTLNKIVLEQCMLNSRHRLIGQRDGDS